jgi:hypothetical protein
VRKRLDKGDFKSLVSTNFTIPAGCRILSAQCLLIVSAGGTAPRTRSGVIPYPP